MGSMINQKPLAWEESKASTFRLTVIERQKAPLLQQLFLKCRNIDILCSYPGF